MVQSGSRRGFQGRRWCYVFEADGIDFNKPEDREKVYLNRIEHLAGSRVMVCYGELKMRDIPFIDICARTWDFRNKQDISYLPTLTSTDFLVIDELELPAKYNGIRPTEYDRPKDETVILTPFLKKELKKIGFID